MAAPQPPPNSVASVLEGVDFPDETQKASLDSDKRMRAVEAALATVEELKGTVRGTRDRKGRIRRAKFIAAVLALRFQGFRENGEIAKVLGCSVQQVAIALQQVRKDATIEQQLTRIDEIVVPLAVDNVIHGVAKGDKTYTLRVMDGRGLFRVHKSIDAQVKNTTIVMRVDMTVPKHLPPGAPLPVPKPGTIVGASELSAGNAPALPPPVPGEHVSTDVPIEVQTPAGRTVAVLATPDV